MTRRRRQRILVAAAAVLVIIPLIAAGCADRLILPPQQRVAVQPGAQRQILGKHRHLEAFVARSPGARDREPLATILRFTGGDAAAAAPFTASRWQHRAVEVCVVNYPGYGASHGPRTLQSLADAAIDAFDELHAANPDRPIILEGFSLGTVPALHIAAARPVAALILQNPPPLREHILLKHGWWNLWLIAGPIALSVPRDFDSIANARQATAPAVFLMAERDQAIPPDHQRRIYDAFAGGKRLIIQRGADHVTPLDDATAAQLHDAMDWLMGQISPVGSRPRAR